MELQAAGTPPTLAPARGTIPRVPPVPVIAAAAVLYAAIATLKFAGVLDMTGGELVVVGVRIAVPLLILRYWLVGVLLAMAVDTSDVILIDLLGMGGFQDHYAETDKLLDSYYYVLMLLVALAWANPWTRWPAVALFAYRLVGALLFEVTHDHIMLFIFPNLYENWWIYCVVVRKWWPKIEPSNWRNTLTPLVLLLIPKMAQEYILHFAELKPWGFTKEHILEPIGIKL